MSGAPWWEDFRAAAQDPPPSGREVAPPPPPAPAPSTAGSGHRRVTRPPQRPQRPQRGERALKVLAAVLGLVLLVLVGVLAVRVLGGRPGGAAAGSAAPSTPATSIPTSSAPTTSVPAPSPPASTADGTAAAAAAAQTELEDLREAGLAAHPPQGQWVAQLAAKSIGTTDPGQTAANGSSTFYAADILAQSRAIAAGVAGGDVFVLRSTDVGTASVDARGNPFWLTLAAGPFADADDVRTWCDSVFAATPAPERANACLPKQLIAAG